MQKMKLYPKGFIFSDESLPKLPNYYKLETFLDTYNYWYDEDMCATTFEHKESFIIIHGEYVHIGIDNQFTEKGLLKHLLMSFHQDYDNFLDIMDYIAGRYAIIIGDRNNVFVYPDASNTRTIYYSTKHQSIASHVYLLKDQ